LVSLASTIFSLIFTGAQQLMESDFSAHRIATKATLLLTATFLITVATLAVSPQGWLSLMTKTNPPASIKPKMAPSAPALTTGVSAQNRVETEIVTLGSTGFEPGALTRPQGRFYLEVDNRSELPEVEFKISTESGQQLFQAIVPHEQLDWQQELDLAPGRYLLTEANHPEWVCQINITQ
jgi:hypothetical protein